MTYGSSSTCATLPPWVRVSAYTHGVHCQLVDNAGIGLQSIIDAGPLGAVDIWGPPNLRADVCFATLGKIIFLNATTIPRSQQTLPVYYPGDGATCAHINAPGSVILLPGGPDPAAIAQSQAQTEAPSRWRTVASRRVKTSTPA